MVDATEKDWPAMGSVVEYLDRHAEAALPPGLRRDFPSYLYLPNPLGHIQGYDRLGQIRRLARAGPTMPSRPRIDKRGPKDNPYFRDCTDAELDFRIQGSSAARPDRRPSNRRVSLLEQFDQARRQLDQSTRVREYGHLQAQGRAI